MAAVALCGHDHDVNKSRCEAPWRFQLRFSVFMKLSKSESAAVAFLAAGPVKIIREDSRWIGLPSEIRSIKTFETLHRKGVVQSRTIEGGFEFTLNALRR